MNLSMILMLINAFFAIVIGIYFWNLLRSQKSNRSAVDRESKKEMDKLRKMRSITLTKPLAEKTRPVSMKDIVGQKDGLRALKAAALARSMSLSTDLQASGRRLLLGLY